MPGKIIKIGNKHYCELPNLHKWKNRHMRAEETQWQCDDCNLIYEVYYSRYSGYMHWKVLPEDKFKN